MASDLLGEEVATPQETGSQLVVMFKTPSSVRVNAFGLESASEDVAPVQALLDRHHGSLKLLFGQDENRLRRQQAEALRSSTQEAEELSAPIDDGDMPDLASFYYVDGPIEDKEDLAADLSQQDLVEAAYVTPPTTLPLLVQPLAAPEHMDAPPITPDYTARQIYLGPAPAGIDVRFAQTWPGGKGKDMTMVDVEWGWRFTHEDLKMLHGGVLAGTNSTNVHAVNHGTAVCGVVSGDVNDIGILGIAPDAVFSASSLEGQSVATAIKTAADKLKRGDLMLLEVHRAGPNARGPPESQQGYIAVEWWPAEYAAIRYAVNKGVVVVEAAGNGSENLDDTTYSIPQAGFPSWWRNPFDLRNPSSGAIIVGAGCPPPGVHGRNHGPDRSRLPFSNYGSRVDCQGWGREVTSTGYGDLQGGTSQDLWYTDVFNGTSSASPMPTGVVLCVQGIRKEGRKRFLTSPEYRNLLRQTGSPQQQGPNAPVSQRIGNRPDLKQLIPAAMSVF